MQQTDTPEFAAVIAAFNNDQRIFCASDATEEAAAAFKPTSDAIRAAAACGLLQIMQYFQTRGGLMRWLRVGPPKGESRLSGRL